MYQYNYAFEFVRSIQAGWNLGNTFDCVAHPEQLRAGKQPEVFESAWGNIPVNRGQLEAIRDAGFNALRIPVTWFQHIGEAPDYRIDEDWMIRIDSVVREAFSLGFRVIVNVHHDGTDRGILHLQADELDRSEEILCKIWAQIAAYFSELGESLVFEVMNEPHVAKDFTGNAEYYAAVNRLNAAAVRTIRAAGGCNGYRYLMLPTYAATYKKSALDAFELPDDDRLIVSIHPYVPTEFCFAANEVHWAKPQETWGSKEDIDKLLDMFRQLEKRFVSKGIPVILGEMAAVEKADSRSRMLWLAVYAREAAARCMPCFWWDNGQIGAECMGIFDRRTLQFPCPELVSILTGKRVD